MVLTRIKEVPPYLQCGLLFASFNLGDDTEFEVPDDCFKRDATVNSQTDLVLILKSLRYWLVDTLPIECFAYAVGSETDCAFEFVQRDVFKSFESQLVKFTKIRGSDLSKKVSDSILLGCGVKAVQCLHGRGCVLSEDDCVATAYQGDLASLLYLREQNCPWDERTAYAAIVAGNIDCLDYALQRNCPHTHVLCIELAVMSGHCEVLEYLLLRGLSASANALLLAVTTNRLDCLKQLTDAGVEWSDHACYYAVQNRNLDILKYLHDQGCPWSPTNAECNLAAQTNQLELLVFLHTHGALWDAETMYVAAENGHVAWLQYAHQHGCEVGIRLLGAAIVGRNWACFQYALRAGHFASLNTTAVILIHSLRLLPTCMYDIYINRNDLHADSSIVFFLFSLSTALFVFAAWTFLLNMHFGPYLKAYCSEEALVETMKVFLVATSCSVATCVVCAVGLGIRQWF